MAELADILRETTEAMACSASVDMDLWNRHSNACLKAIAALEAEQPVAVEEWRPIETAPHEINVLLAWPDSSLPGGWRMEAGMASWGWRRSGVSNMSSHGQATHWRPLPTPPSSPRISASSAEAGGSAISTIGGDHG